MVLLVSRFLFSLTDSKGAHTFSLQPGNGANELDKPCLVEMHREVPSRICTSTSQFGNYLTYSLCTVLTKAYLWHQHNNIAIMLISIRQWTIAGKMATLEQVRTPSDSAACEQWWLVCNCGYGRIDRHSFLLLFMASMSELHTSYLNCDFYIYIYIYIYISGMCCFVYFWCWNLNW